MLSVFYRAESQKAELVENARNIFVKGKIKETSVHSVDSKRVFRTEDEGVQRSSVLVATSEIPATRTTASLLIRHQQGKKTVSQRTVRKWKSPSECGLRHWGAWRGIQRRSSAAIIRAQTIHTGKHLLLFFFANIVWIIHGRIRVLWRCTFRRSRFFGNVVS